MLRILLIIGFVFAELASWAQPTIGQTEIINFSHERTQGGTQNWEIAQDRQGVMYFANNSGLLTYNSREWKLFPLPNKSMVRSLALSREGRIYVGGQDALGYFFPNHMGTLAYHSLLPHIPAEHLSFGDVWNIILSDSAIYCRTSRRIFKIDIHKKRKTEVFVAPNESRWAFMGMSANRLIAQNGHQNVVEFVQNQWKPLNQASLAQTLLTAVLPYAPDTIMVVTMRNGIYLLTKNTILPFASNKVMNEAPINTAKQMPNQEFAFGTQSDGIFFMNKKGKEIRHFSIENGLQNNNIRSLWIDAQHHLWAGLDEGIAIINYNSPIQRISPFSKGRIATYASLVVNNELLIGTADGLYKTPIQLSEGADLSQSQGSFLKVPNSGGQIWSLQVLSNKVLIGHHDGAFLYHQQVATSPTRLGGGYWLYRPMAGNNRILAGTYQGLHQLIPTSSGFRADSLFDNKLKEPLRFVEIDTGRHIIWASHPNRGIYRFNMSPDGLAVQEVKLFTSTNGLPSNKDNYVFRLKNNIVFCTEAGVYNFNDTTNRFEPNSALNAIFGNISIRFLTTDLNNRIWFATNKKVGYVAQQTLHYLPELDDMLVPGFENINPYNDENIFIGSSNGLMHLNLSKHALQQVKIEASFSKILAGKKYDSLLFDGYFIENNLVVKKQPANAAPQLAAHINSFHFQFASNQYTQASNVQYRYKLEGFDQEWSEWSRKSEKEYTNISKGKYTFMLQAQSPLGAISPAVMFSFEILPRWYQTWWAKLIYSITAACLLFIGAKFHQNRLEKQRIAFEKEEAQLKYLHDLEIEHNERAIIKLQKEQLESEIHFKNKELATATMHLYKRGKLLSKIKEDLDQATKNLNEKSERKDFVKLLKLIVEEEKREGDWEEFAIHFDEVHNKFLQNLKTSFPALTSTDLKMSAYLKMNLSTKEIAQLMNITIKGVEVSKYRLRKKLDLPIGSSLSSFINSFG